MKKTPFRRPYQKHTNTSPQVGPVYGKERQRHTQDRPVRPVRPAKNYRQASHVAKERVTAKTSWGKEAEWYKEHLEQGDTYHEKVILPNLLRIVEPMKGTRVLEIGCGEGFFSRAFSEAGATVVASDIGKELIDIAKKKGGRVEYRVSKAEDLSWVKPHSQDVVVAVLTLQNMEKIELVIKEVARVLASPGRFVCVLNHPTFRIPKATEWGYDEEKRVQYRRVDGYLSARSEKLDMHPGKQGAKSFTYSYHRSLQDYMKALRSAGLAITRLEEWISHKTSERGPRKHAEDTARKEFPLFMMLEAGVHVTK